MHTALPASRPACSEALLSDCVAVKRLEAFRDEGTLKGELMGALASK